jgi:Family of unknown function (DUF5519)
VLVHRLGVPAYRDHMASTAERIASAVLAWPGVEAAPHRFGGVELRVGRRELGHLHGDHSADLPFPLAVHDRLIAEGRARRHRWLPDSGWVTVPLRDDDEAVAGVVDLFRLGYDRAVAARARRKP